MTEHIHEMRTRDPSAERLPLQGEGEIKIRQLTSNTRVRHHSNSSTPNLESHSPQQRGLVSLFSPQGLILQPCRYPNRTYPPNSQGPMSHITSRRLDSYSTARGDDAPPARDGRHCRHTQPPKWSGPDPSLVMVHWAQSSALIHYSLMQSEREKSCSRLSSFSYDELPIDGKATRVNHALL